MKLTMDFVDGMYMVFPAVKSDIIILLDDPYPSNVTVLSPYVTG